MDWRSPKARQLIEALGVSGDAGEVPTSAIKDLREGRGLTQTRLAAQSGLSQALIVALENGQRSLSLKSARQLAGPLGMDEEDLLVWEKISELQRAAVKGELNPRRMLDTIEGIAHSLDDSSQVDQALAGALAEVLQKAVETYGAGQPGAAMKSAAEGRQGRGRDALGRKKDKPNDPRSR